MQEIHAGRNIVYRRPEHPAAAAAWLEPFRHFRRVSLLDLKRCAETGELVGGSVEAGGRQGLINAIDLGAGGTNPGTSDGG